MRVRDLLRRDDGIGMVTVLILGFVIIFMTGIIAARGASTLDRVTDHRRWDRAVHVAEAALDHTLYELTLDSSYTTGEVVPASFSDEEAERQWALDAAAGKTPTPMKDGEWVAIRPSNAALVYAVGYAPSRDDPVFTRVIRASYDFAPFAPPVALLTDDDLTVVGNPTFSGAAGSVHANGDLLVSGSVSATGFAAAHGTYTVTGSVSVADQANTGGGRPSREVPAISPRDHYGLSEYDLCPDGKVRAGPAYAGPEGASTAETPCQGPELGTATEEPYRGWRKTGDDGNQGAKWGLAGNTTYDGVYYAYQGSAKITGSPGSPATPWQLTLLAEGTETDAGPCPITGGDIQVVGNPTVVAYPSAKPLLFWAGRDLEISGSPAMGTSADQSISGSREQLKISGSPTAHGSFIAESTCNTSGSGVDTAESRVTGNPVITYTGGLELPSGDRIRVTLWLELN